MTKRILPIALPHKLLFAKKLRYNQTKGEMVMWQKLRAKRFHGLKFRRQVPIGPFIVDFLCLEKMCIIEVDGDSHFQPGRQEYDTERDGYLYRKGFRIIRVSNKLVIENVTSVLEEIGGKLGLPE